VTLSFESADKSLTSSKDSNKKKNNVNYYFSYCREKLVLTQRPELDRIEINTKRLKRMYSSNNK
jgi:hypothetical protein